MLRQAANGCMVVTLLLAAVCVAEGPARPGTASITGRVVTLDGHPAENAWVDLRDVLTGSSLRSTYTNPFGQFEIGNIPPGRYLIVATSGLDEVRESVQVSQLSGGTEVILRLPRQFGATSAGDSNSVSVQQLKVPAKARSALKHAQEALAKQHTDEAWKEVDKALALYPTYAEALTLRGVLKLAQDNSAAALADMEEAVKADPGYAMGYVALGAAYNAQSRFDDALRVLDRGVALSPNAWQGYYEMGRACVGKSDFQSALGQLDKAQRLAPDTYAPLHLVKAHALLGLKAYDDAVAEFEAYLSRNPKGEGSDHARDTLEKVRAFMAKGEK